MTVRGSQFLHRNDPGLTPFVCFASTWLLDAGLREMVSQHEGVERLPRVPLTFIGTTTPACSGKTILLQSMVLDWCNDCLCRIFSFSSSINVDSDSVWLPVKDYKPRDPDVSFTSEH